MRIGIDIDGVIIDSISVWLSLLEKEYSCGEIKQEDLQGYNVECVTGLTSWEVLKVFDKCVISPDLKVFNDVERVINNWSLWGHKIFIVTSRSLRHKKETIKMLNSFNIEYDHLIMTKEPKMYVANCELDLDIMIDDNINEFINDESKIKKILMSRPYNRTLNLGNRMIICSNWNEIEEEVSKIESLGI